MNTFDGDIWNDREGWFLSEIDSLKAENSKLKECLEFYANEENWIFPYRKIDSKIILDQGKIARKTLKELKHELDKR